MTDLLPSRTKYKSLIKQAKKKFKAMCATRVKDNQYQENKVPMRKNEERQHRNETAP
jgi:hypothetical protein